jgi:hypothetical protein
VDIKSVTVATPRVPTEPPEYPKVTLYDNGTRVIDLCPSPAKITSQALAHGVVLIWSGSGRLVSIVADPV